MASMTDQNECVISDSDRCSKENASDVMESDGQGETVVRQDLPEKRN